MRSPTFTQPLLDTMAKLLAALTALLALSALAFPGLALADQVLLFPPTGTDNEELSDDVEEALAAALISLGHQPMSESLAYSGEPPVSGNEMRAVAEMERSAWVVVPSVRGSASLYHLRLRVGQASDGRVEELEVAVLGGEEEAARLRDVLSAMLRAEGVGDDAVRLTEAPDETAAREAAEAAAREEEERRRQEEEEARAREDETREQFLARQREREAEEARREQEAWEGREQYGQRDAPWLLSAGVDVRPIVAAPAGASGGMLWGLSARLGRSFEGVPGFEVRGTVEAFGGSSSGFAVAIGAAYLHSFFAEFPLFLGATFDLGLFMPFTGNNSASFMLRGGPTVTWRVGDEVHLELAVAEIQWMSLGAATVGGAIRLGYRF